MGDAVIQDPTGLHARPAVKLTKLAKGFSSDIEVRAGEEGAWVNAKSPNAVMKLKARHGERLHLRADGDDAETAVTPGIFSAATRRASRWASESMTPHRCTTPSETMMFTIAL